MSNHICLIGLQWGDEGKGKIVDYLAKEVDAVVRFQGGGNAGHTVYVGGEKYIFHHIPVGVLSGKLSILGNGMVIEPKEFIEEYDNLTLEQQALIRVSEGAHIVLPEYLETDRLREKDETKTKIGTTLRGIGPTYEAKYARLGRQVRNLRWRRDSMLLEEFYRRIMDKIVNVADLLYDLDAQGRTILFEGAQGVLLDIDFGQYPYVTSSHCTSLGIGIGTGFSPRKISRVIGVAKVYPTRVGTGPFPSFAGNEDQVLRDAGNEYGATTGRPRLCGWLDVPAMKYAIKIGDVDEIALTKIDILNGRAEIPVCVAYRYDDNISYDYYTDTGLLDICEPVYEYWPGWNDVDGAETFIQRLEEVLGVPITMVGNGPNRTDLFMRTRCDD
jgi:adenylosuccinate synthase